MVMDSRRPGRQETRQAGGTKEPRPGGAGGVDQPGSTRTITTKYISPSLFLLCIVVFPLVLLLLIWLCPKWCVVCGNYWVTRVAAVTSVITSVILCWVNWIHTHFKRHKTQLVPVIKCSNVFSFDPLELFYCACMIFLKTFNSTDTNLTMHCGANCPGSEKQQCATPNHHSKGMYDPPIVLPYTFFLGSSISLL